MSKTNFLNHVLLINQITVHGAMSISSSVWKIRERLMMLVDLRQRKLLYQFESNGGVSGRVSRFKQSVLIYAIFSTSNKKSFNYFFAVSISRALLGLRKEIWSNSHRKSSLFLKEEAPNQTN